MCEKEYEAMLGLLKLGSRRMFLYEKNNKLKKSSAQKRVLEEVFSMTSYPSSSTQHDLSILLNIPQRSIQIWFQNARHKLKTECKGEEVFKDENNDIPVSTLCGIVSVNGVKFKS